MLVVKIHILLLWITINGYVRQQAVRPVGGNFKLIIWSDILTVDMLRAVEREAVAQG